MSYIKSLRCKECGAEYAIEPRTVCDHDFGPVEVTYDYDAMRGKVTRQSIEAGPRSLWRYRDLLPIEGEPRAGLRSGMTPLVKAERLAARDFAGVERERADEERQVVTLRIVVGIGEAGHRCAVDSKGNGAEHRR